MVVASGGRGKAWRCESMDAFCANAWFPALQRQSIDQLSGATRSLYCLASWRDRRADARAGYCWNAHWAVRRPAWGDLSRPSSGSLLPGTYICPHLGDSKGCTCTLNSHHLPSLMPPCTATHCTTAHSSCTLHSALRREHRHLALGTKHHARVPRAAHRRGMSCGTRAG